MAQDLLNFTSNSYFEKIIYDKGTSLSVGRSIFALVIFPLPLGFLFNKCPNHINFIHYDYQKMTFMLICIILLSAYYCYRYVVPLIRKYKGKSWKRKTANILNVNIIRIKVAYRFGSSIEYFPYIEYVFQVNNREYYSDKLSFESDYNYNFSLNEEISNRYHSMNNKFSKWIDENKVEIYYNPKDPTQSVVFRNFHPMRNIFYIFFGIISIITFVVSILDFTCWIYWTT